MVQPHVVEGPELVLLVVVVVAPPPPPLGFEGQPSCPEGLREVAPPQTLLHSEGEQGIQHPDRLLLSLFLGVVGALVGAVGDLWVQLEPLLGEEGVLVKGKIEWRLEWSLLLWK